MAKDDIYGSKAKYERFMADLECLLGPGSKPKRGKARKYFCRVRSNLKYFREFHREFESRDTSYVRRRRIFCTLLFLVHYAEVDLSELDRKGIDRIVRHAHAVNKSIESKKTIIWNIKFIWRVLFPDKDSLGREDETIVPYVVRHLRATVDRSQQTLRADRLTWEELVQILEYFSGKPMIQAYIALSVESLGRPQELCFRRLKDVEIHDNYAQVWVSSHGKEGVKILQCIDSFPYLMKWLEIHPFKRNQEAYLFNSGDDWSRPIRPESINKYLKKAVKSLGIDKPISPYSLKRNGITFSRLRGDSDVDIQRRAGWTSTRQLQTYDMSTCRDAMQKELEKRGMAKGVTTFQGDATAKLCACGNQVGHSVSICGNCRRIVGSSALLQEKAAEDKMKEVLSVALENPDQSIREILERVIGGRGSKAVG